MARNDQRLPLGVLAALARGALGDGYTSDVPGRIIEMVDRVPSPADKIKIARALRMLDTRAGALAMTGRAVPVSWLTSREAEKLLIRWKNGRIKAQRDLADVIVGASMMALYAHPGPEWQRVGYPGPLGPPPSEPKRLQPVEVTSDETISCDVVIVGSGAGGGCVAGKLAVAGYDVVVLEKGGYSSEADFTHIEADAYRDMYLYGATLATHDGGIRIFAGSTLGGGTVVNWSTSWKTPQPVLEEWARVSGIDAFASGEMEESLDEVCDRLLVNTDSSAAGKRDELLEEGLKRLGWHVDAMPRNVQNCPQDEHCGYCTFGCRFRAKQSSMITYLEEAHAAGAKMFVRADARKVIVRDGRAVGVEAIVGSHRLTVNARAVVAACGSVETPALLLRSGLRGRVGYNLRLHPATAVAGLFDEEVHLWEGVMQARYTNELNGPWSGGYGATLETGPAHPGSWASVLPWTGAAEHRERMAGFPYTSVAGFPSRDLGSGRVAIDKYGVPRLEYAIPSNDEARIVDALVAAGKVLEAAGAREIWTQHRRSISYVPGPGAHERWADDVRARGARTGNISLFSMHQMGSCAMGVDPQRSAIGPNNESHEVRDLFVVDASTFPTPSGVNPMISIYGIANRAAKKIAERLS